MKAAPKILFLIEKSTVSLSLITILFLVVDAVAQVPAACLGNCSSLLECQSSMQSCEEYIGAVGNPSEAIEALIRQETYSDPDVDPVALSNLKLSWCFACCKYGFTGDSIHPCFFSCPCVRDTTTTTLNVWSSGRRPKLNQSIEAVTDVVNYNVCLLLNILWLVASGVAVLVVITSGLKYMASESAAKRRNARNRIIYSVLGLALISVLCPLIDFLIENTELTSIENSCRCYELVAYRGGVTPTLPPISNVTTRPLTTLPPKLPDGSNCTKGYQCESEICTEYGFCCREGQCGYAYRCYNQSQEKPDGEVCDKAKWKKKNNRSCSGDDDECLSGNCNNFICCPKHQCGYNNRCYEDGLTRQPDNAKCVDEEWITTTTTTTTTTSTTVPKKLKIVFVRLDGLDSGIFNSAADEHANFMLNNIPLKDCPEAFEYVKLTDNCVVNVPYDENTCLSMSGSIIQAIKDCANRAGSYDYAVGLSDSGRCGNRVQGFSTNTAGAVYVKYPYYSVTAHEIGHQWGLRDEYCSQLCPGCPSGPNLLSSDYGCDPTIGSSCCWRCVGYDIGCYGNVNSAGGRCVMSYANAPEPRAFCVACWNHLKKIPRLNC